MPGSRCRKASFAAGVLDLQKKSSAYTVGPDSTGGGVGAGRTGRELTREVRRVFLAGCFFCSSVFFGALAGFFWFDFLTADRRRLCAFFARLLALRAAFFASLNACLAAFNLLFASFARALAVSNRPSASRTAMAAAETSGELLGESVDLRL